MPVETQIDGQTMPITLYRWAAESPDHIVVLAHGYAEHARRYDHVAQALVGNGAVVYAADYPGHGKTGGERAVVSGIDDLAADTEAVVNVARSDWPELPVVMLGHSMGGITATRYAQMHGRELTALVLSGPAIGGNPDLLGMVALPEIPEVPIDPSWLSRDPEVGRAYVEDELVYNGPFKRPTLEMFVAAVQQVAGGGSLGDLPTLWVHGENDPLAPLGPAGEAIDRIRGSAMQEKVYPGAMHEILNETNKDEVIGDVVGFIATTVKGSPKAVQTPAG
jgi:alpha-beta hydrolase superfamily lysophospholipase